jgi:hypothetical protein
MYTWKCSATTQQQYTFHPPYIFIDYLWHHPYLSKQRVSSENRSQNYFESIMVNVTKKYVANILSALYGQWSAIKIYLFRCDTQMY